MRSRTTGGFSAEALTSVVEAGYSPLPSPKAIGDHYFSVSLCGVSGSQLSSSIATLKLLLYPMDITSFKYASTA